MLSFTILTTEAYEGIRDLHTRMPMILNEQGRKSWLEGEPPALASDIDTAIALLSSLDAGQQAVL